MGVSKIPKHFTVEVVGLWGKLLQMYPAGVMEGWCYANFAATERVRDAYPYDGTNRRALALSVYYALCKLAIEEFGITRSCLVVSFNVAGETGLSHRVVLRVLREFAALSLITLT